MKYLVVASLLIICISSPSCVGIKKDNEETKSIDVDWYVVNFISLGEDPKEVAFDYMDSTMEISGTKPTRYTLSKSETPMIRTLSRVNQEYGRNEKKMKVVAWNDHPPGKEASSNYAHSKGFLAFDNAKGLLMNHSLPKFPIKKGKLFSEEFDTNFGTYMQHFYCQNYDNSALSTIFEVLRIIKPNVYMDVQKGDFSDFENDKMKVNDKNNSTKIFEIVKTATALSSTSKISQAKPRKIKLREKMTPEQANKLGAMIKNQRKMVKQGNLYSFLALNRGKSKNASDVKIRNLLKKHQKYNTSSLKPRRSRRLAKKSFNQISLTTENQTKRPLPRIRSEKKTTITFFAKSHTQTDFLPWSKEILEKYKKDFYSLTWRAKSMDTDKNIRNKVFIVSKIKMGADNSMDIDSESKNIPEEKKHTQNHAKWAVSTKGEIVCFGDLNHHRTQLKRGGMIICFENKMVGNYFYNRVAEYN